MAFGFKSGGRQKGALNKTTLQNREKMQAVWQAMLDSGQLQQALSELSARELVSAFFKLTAYMVPRANNQNMPGPTIEETLTEEPEMDEMPEQAGDTVAEGPVEQPVTLTITPEEVETFRVNMGMSKDEMDRFMRGEKFQFKGMP